MRIEITIVQNDPITLEEFGDLHKLTLSISETRCNNGHYIYSVRFNNCEIKNGCILSSEYGRGETIEHAIRDYISLISNKVIVLDAYKNSRRVINVPELKYYLPDLRDVILIKE
jgi:hypothetical protein